MTHKKANKTERPLRADFGHASNRLGNPAVAGIAILALIVWLAVRPATTTHPSEDSSTATPEITTLETPSTLGGSDPNRSRTKLSDTFLGTKGKHAPENSISWETAKLPPVDALERGSKVSIPLPDGSLLEGRVNNTEISERERFHSVGGEFENGRFSLTLHNGSLDGYIFRKDQFYTVTEAPDGEVSVSEARAAAYMCQNYPIHPEEVPMESEAPSDQPQKIELPNSDPPPALQSLPGANAVVYIDCDGEISTTSRWNGGNSITAAASGFSDSEVTEIWARVSEDYRPFSINVTTDVDVYWNAPETSRVRCIVTPTNEWYGSAAGVAYTSTFERPGDEPCWVFITSSAKNTAQAVAHETGHTFGLSHDGQQNISSYYSGHGGGETSWGPIMGTPYYRTLTQWSKGEYNGATNTQDDLAIIDSNNNVHHRSDDYGNSIGSAGSLNVASNNQVGGAGIIETTGDEDFLEFQTSGGSYNLHIAPHSPGPNLDLLAELFNSGGQLIASDNPEDATDADLSGSISAGTYYLRITGTGKGDPLGSGYTNYGCLGNYSVSGSVPYVGPDPIDTTPPAVTLGTGTSQATGPFAVSVSFSESVSGLSSGDFSVGNGTAAGLSGNGHSYSLTVNPESQGQVTVYLPANRASDGAGNGNTASNTVEVNYTPADTQAPSVTLSTESSEVSGSFTVSAQFSESVTGLSSGDFSINNGTATGLSGNGESYTLTVNPSNSGQVLVTLPSNRASDAAGNGNTASNTVEVNYTPADTQAPSVTLSTGSSEVSGDFTVSVQFDESVTGLSTTDFSVSNGSTVLLGGGGSSYVLTVTPSSSGPVGISLPSNRAFDAAGNGNTSSNSISVSYVVPEGPSAINFNDYGLSSFGRTQDQGYGVIQDGGATVYLESNAWKSIPLNYTVKSNTVLEVDFRSTRNGEILGIGFDTNTRISSGYTFALHGTQKWGIRTYHGYSGNGAYQTYVIPVGQFYTGSFKHLFFAADHDKSPRNGNAWFSNVKVYESSSSNIVDDVSAKRTPIHSFEDWKDSLTEEETSGNPDELLTAYAFGVSVGQEPYVRVDRRSGQLVFSHRGRLGDVKFLVESSVDLRTWQPWKNKEIHRRIEGDLDEVVLEGNTVGNHGYLRVRASYRPDNP